MLAKPVLTAAAGQNAVELTWPEVTGADRYELWTWTSAGGWQQIGGDNLTATTYNHSGLTTGTTYFYQIRAVNAAGQTSPWSDRVSATVPASLPAPVVTATAAEGEIELGWPAVADAARYQLWAWTSAGGWQPLDDGQPDRHDLHPHRRVGRNPTTTPSAP